MNSNARNPLSPPLALGGALLLLISLFLDWFSLDADAQGQNVSLGFARPDTAVLLLVVVIALAVAYALARMRGDSRDGPGKTLLIAAGAAVFLYALVTLIKKPQLLDLASSAFDEAKKQAGGQLGGADFGVGTEIGLYLALLGGLLVLAAGIMEMMGSNTGSGPRPGSTQLGGGGTPPPAPAAAPAGGGGGAAPPADRSPGWQPDPHGQARLRYWDGNAWTEHTGG